MIETKRYKKAYTELYEVLKALSKEDIDKIPNDLIDDIKVNMDNKYKWEYDFSKSLTEQELMSETKALIVEIYERYLSPDSEKKIWKEYDTICLKKIEEKKKHAYGANNIFKNK